MKRFPVTIVDNFYENAEIVRDFALSQKYYPTKGRYPGERTETLSLISQEFFNNFCERLFSLFYDFSKTRLTWDVHTSFQKICSLSSNKHSKFNEGWIHQDECVFSGVVYLSKSNLGTSIYYPKVPGVEITSQDEKFTFYSGEKIDEEIYAKAITENNNNFYETIRVSGEFNRLLLFEGGLQHGVPSFYSENEDRLTQVFFVYEINDVENMGNYPIVRSKVR